MDSSPKQFAQKESHTGFVQLMLGNSDHSFVEQESVFGGFDSVQFQKGQRGRHGRAFVAVEKSLSLCDVKRVSRRNPKQVCPAVPVIVLRLIHRGLKRSLTTNALRPSVLNQRVFVEEQDFIKCQDFGSSVPDLTARAFAAIPHAL